MSEKLTREIALALRQEGKTVTEIARMYGVTPTRVSQLARQREKPRISGETRNKALELWAGGMAPKTIAERLGIGHMTVSRLVREAHGPLTAGTSVTADQRAQILDMHRAGRKPPEIGRILGLHPHQVRRVTQEAKPRQSPTRAEVRRALAAGLSRADLASTAGVPEAAVNRWLDESGELAADQVDALLTACRRWRRQ